MASRRNESTGWSRLASVALPVDDLGGCGERVDVCCVRDAGAVLVGVSEWWGQGPFVADSLGTDHPEADVVLEPLGESPEAAGCRCVLVSRGGAGETREAVRPQPHVSLLQTECERLTVVALSGGHIALVKIEVAEAVHRGRSTAEPVCAPNLDGADEQLGGPLEIAELPESLSDAVQSTGDPQRVVEALIDRKRLLRPCEGALRRTGDERGETLALLSLSAAESIAGAPESSLAWAEQALPIYERLDDTLGIARCLHYIAQALRDLGDFERSAELYTRSIEIRRAHGLGSGRATVHSLGDLSLDKGDTPTAERYYREALALGLQEGDVRLGAYCLAGLACVAARNEDATTAGRLWTLAERLEHEIGFRMVAAERVRYERNLTPPLTNTDEYRAGIAEAANIEPFTAAAEIVNR